MRRWHFPLNVNGQWIVVPDSPEAQAEYNSAIPLKDLWRFGEGLHVLQDSFSHRGKPGIIYFDPISGTYAGFGHPDARGGWMSTAADQLDRYRIDAIGAAAATFRALLEYRSANDRTFSFPELERRWADFEHASIEAFVRLDKQGRVEWLKTGNVTLTPFE